jgi:hypothetical protein
MYAAGGWLGLRFARSWLRHSHANLHPQFGNPANLTVCLYGLPNRHLPPGVMCHNFQIFGKYKIIDIDKLWIICKYSGIGEDMKFSVGILFFCFVIASCNKSTDGVILSSNDAETRKYINENIFYGINLDQNYYIQNNEYIVEEYFQESIPAFGVNHDIHGFMAKNDDLIVSFANNILENVYINNKTNKHFLGNYIGKNINEINSIIGKEDWNYNNIYVYYNLNGNNNYIKIVTLGNNGENISYIEIGADNGLIKKTLGIYE